MYDVGITIFLVDRITSGMGVVSKAMMAAGGQTTALQKKISALQSKMMAIQAMGSLGQSMMRGSVGVLESIIEPTKEYIHQVNMMNMAGIKQVEIQKNIAAAARVSGEVLTSTSTENLKVLGDLRTIFGRSPAAMQESRDLLPKFQEVTAVLRAASENMSIGKSGEDLAFSMAKAIEMKGNVRNTKMFAHDMDMMEKVMIATQGKVLPSDYQNMLKYARQAKLTLNDDFMYKAAPELMLEMKGKGGSGGGGGPGAMIAALFRLGVQGIMSKTTAANLAKIGMLDHPVLKTTTTGTTVTGSDGLVGAAMLAANPARWVNSVLIPHLRGKSDLLGMSAAEERKINMRIPQTFKGNQMAIALIGELFNKRLQFAKFADSVNHVPGHQQSVKNAMNSPVNAAKSVAAQMKQVQTMMGKDMLVVMLPVMKAFAKGLHVVAEVFRQHPVGAKLTVIGIAAIGLVGGLIALGAAFAPVVWLASTLGVGLLALGGWIVGAIVAVAALGAAFTGTLPKGIKDALKAVSDFGNKIRPYLADPLKLVDKVMRKFADGVNGLIDLLTKAGAAQDLVNSAIKMFTSALSGLWAQIGQILGGALRSNPNSSLFGLRPGAAKGAAPNYAAGKQGGAVGSAVKIGNISMNVTQHHGENGEQFSKRAIDHLKNEIAFHVTNATAGHGSYESPYFQGA